MVNRLRNSSRILVFDRDGRILLHRTKAPDTSGFSRWITPGGGVDPGETHEQAAIRELFEETGLVVADVGEPVWSHDFVVSWDAADHDRGHAEFYRIIVDHFDPVDDHWTPEEHVDVLDVRWWNIADLIAESPPFEPAELIELIRRASADGYRDSNN